MRNSTNSTPLMFKIISFSEKSRDLSPLHARTFNMTFFNHIVYLQQLLGSLLAYFPITAVRRKSNTFVSSKVYMTLRRISFLLNGGTRMNTWMIVARRVKGFFFPVD